MKDFFYWLDQTGFSNWLRYSPYPFPVLIMLHVVTIGVLGVTVIMCNLRVLGFAMRETSMTEIFKQFRAWKWISFVLLLVTGLLITISDPVE